jgi:NNP family nitrate/nitrite transporter-like MFS transporter
MISPTVLTVDDHLDDDGCPAPVTFQESIGITVFLAWLFFLTFVGRIIFAPLMPAIEQEFGLSHSQAGSIFLMMSLGLFIAPVCSGIISFKINHRGALFVSSLAMGLGLVSLGFIDSLLIIRLVMVILGLAAGLHLPSAMATITAEVRRPDWGKALGVHQSAPPLAFVSAPLIAAALMGWLSWRTIVVLIGVLSLLSVMAYKGFGRGGAFPGRIPNFSIMKTILTKSSFWIMILLFSMAMGGTIGIYTMLPLFLMTERGMDLTWANTLLGLSQISGLFVVFMAGWVTDHVGQKRTMAVVLLAGGILTILLGVLHGGWLVAAIFIQPAFLASFFPGAFAALSRITPPNMRSVTNAIGPPSAFLLGGGLIPTFVGYMGETYTFGLGLILVGCYMLAGPILTIFLKLGTYDDQGGC